MNGTFQRNLLKRNWISLVVPARLSEPNTRQTGISHHPRSSCTGDAGFVIVPPMRTLKLNSPGPTHSPVYLGRNGLSRASSRNPIPIRYPVIAITNTMKPSTQDHYRRNAVPCFLHKHTCAILLRQFVGRPESGKNLFDAGSWIAGAFANVHANFLHDVLAFG